MTGASTPVRWGEHFQWREKVHQRYPDRWDLKIVRDRLPFVVGDGAVTGACSLVIRDVPPYAIVVGNSAQVMRHRFDAETVQKLLRIKW